MPRAQASLAVPDQHLSRSLPADRGASDPPPAPRPAILADREFGITLAAQSRAEVAFPGVVYKPIHEEEAWGQVELAWLPTTDAISISDVASIFHIMDTFTSAVGLTTST
jgi:hypothetical protein